MGTIRSTADRLGLRVRAFTEKDRESALECLAASGAFREEEIGIAAGVVDDALADPEGYLILAGEVEGETRGFVCGGSTPLTASTWHLYWICVHPEEAGRGLGRELQSRFEAAARERGARRVVVETSGRADYARARRFYEAAGYRRAGEIPDYYDDGDPCVLYWKELES